MSDTFWCMALESPGEWRRAPMEAWSRTLFGATHRLPVAVLALSAGEDELYAQAVADTLGVEATVAAAHLRALERCNLLRRNGTAPSTGGRPAHRYARTEDEFCTCVQHLRTRFRR